MANTSLMKRWLLIFGIPLVMVGVGVYLWNRPLLGRPLESLPAGLPPGISPTDHPSASQDGILYTPVVEEIVAGDLPLPATPAPQPIEPMTEADPPVQPKSAGTWYILALGVDRVYQTDVIRLVRLDFTGQKVTVVSIPRDLFLPLPGFETYGITQGRINAIYGYGEYFRGSGQGIVAAANAFQMNFGLSFDRYVVGQFSSFVSLVDQVGGIDVTLDEGYYGPDSDGPSFTPGTHHLYGEDTLRLARVRYADDDHHRIDRQTLIIKSLMGKVVESMSILDLTTFGLQTIKEKGVVTDLTAGDLYALARFGKSLAPDDISFVSIPREYYAPARTTSGGSVILPRDELVPFVQAQLGIGE